MIECHSGFIKDVAVNAIHPCEALCKLSLERNRSLTQEGALQELAQFFADHAATLTELDLSSTSLGPQEFTTMLMRPSGESALPMLEKFVLRHVCLGGPHLDNFGHALSLLSNIKQLHLANCQIDAQGMGHLATGISHLSCLETLDLSGNFVEAPGMALLAKHVLSKLPLKLLCLRSCHIDPLSAKELANGFMQLGSLQHLDVSYCHLDEHCIGDLASGLGHLAQLLCLKLSHNAIGAMGARALSENVFPHLGDLKELDVSSCKLFREAAQELASGLGKLKSLKCLVLAQNKFGVQGAQAIATNALAQLSALREFDCSKCGLNAEAMQAFAVALQNTSQLEVLDLQGNDIGLDGAGAIGVLAPALLNLRRLDLRGCELSRIAVEAFALNVSQLTQLELLQFGERKPLAHFVRKLALDSNAPVPQLRKLRAIDVSSCGLTGSYLVQFISGLKLLSQLESLVLKGNDFSANAADELATQAMPCLPKLVYLNMNGCSIGSVAMKSLAQGIVHLASLESLSFRDNEMGSEGAAALATVGIAHIEGLQELILSACDLDATSISSLVTAFPSLPNLRKLGLALNEFGSGGARALAQSFGSLPNLQDLDLNGATLEEDAVRELMPGFEHLSKLLKLNLGTIDIPTDCAVTLATLGLANMLTLKEIELPMCSLDHAAVQALATAFRAPSCLAKMNLMGCEIDEETAEMLAKTAFPHLEQLEELNVSYSRIDAASMLKLAPGLRCLRNLEVLNLRNNELGEDGVRAFAQEAIPSLKRLKTLDLRRCGLDTISVETLATYTSQLGNLRSIEFGDRDLIVHFVASMAHLDHVACMGMFKELNLASCKVGEQSMLDMAAGLCHFQDLEILNLRGNDFGPEASNTLAAALPCMLKLKELHLANCSSGAASWERLACNIGKLLDLEVLNLLGNELGADEVRLLIKHTMPFLAKLRQFYFPHIDAELRKDLVKPLGPNVELLNS